MELVILQQISILQGAPRLCISLTPGLNSSETFSETSTSFEGGDLPPGFSIQPFSSTRGDPRTRLRFCSNLSRNRLPCG